MAQVREHVHPAVDMVLPVRPCCLSGLAMRICHQCSTAATWPLLREHVHLAVEATLLAKTHCHSSPTDLRHASQHQPCRLHKPHVTSRKPITPSLTPGLGRLADGAGDWGPAAACPGGLAGHGGLSCQLHLDAAVRAGELGPQDALGGV